MENWKKSYVNGKPFPNTNHFDGVQNYRIAAECGGYVLGVTEKGDCAVWTGEYKENGELRGVCWGHYFTGTSYGENPNDKFADAFACFTELVDSEQDKIYSLISYDDERDYVNVEKTYTSKYAAMSQGEKNIKDNEYLSFMILNENTNKFEHIDNKFPLSVLGRTFDSNILRSNGYNELADKKTEKELAEERIALDNDTDIDLNADDDDVGGEELDLTKQNVQRGR